MKKYAGQIGGIIVAGYFYGILCLFACVYNSGVVCINTSTALLLSSISGVIAYAFLKSRDMDLYKRKIVKFIIAKIIAFIIMTPLILVFIGSVWNTNSVSIIMVSYITFFILCFIGIVFAGFYSFFNQHNESFIKAYNFVVSKVLRYVNLLLLITEIISAGISIFGIYITSGWSNDTAVMFKAIKFYVLIVIVAAVSILLNLIRKNNNVIYTANMINSILFMIAEVVLMANPYLTRTDYFLLLNVIPLIFGVTGITNKIVK